MLPNSALPEAVKVEVHLGFMLVILMPGFVISQTFVSENGGHDAIIVNIT